MDKEQNEAVKRAIEIRIAHLCDNIAQGPSPYGDQDFGDMIYDQALWAPALRFWLGHLKALVAFCQEQGWGYDPQADRLLETVPGYTGQPYEVCPGCKRWFRPEDFLSNLCLKCDKIAADSLM